MRDNSERLFYEPISSSNKDFSGNIFEIPVSFEKENINGKTLINDSYAKALAKSSKVSEFIKLCMSENNWDYEKLLGELNKGSKANGWFYKVGFAAVYFAVAGAVAAVVIDVAGTRQEDDKLFQNKYLVDTIRFANHYGGVSFASKVSQKLLQDAMEVIKYEE